MYIRINYSKIKQIHNDWEKKLYWRFKLKYIFNNMEIKYDK